MSDPFFDDGARDILRIAGIEAQRLNDDYIDVAHILLGLLEIDAQFNRLLVVQNVSAETVRSELRGDFRNTNAKSQPRRLPFSDGAKNVIEIALRDAQTQEQGCVTPEVLLLAILSEPEGTGIAMLALKNSGLDLSLTKNSILQTCNLNQDNNALDPSGEAE